MTAIPQPPSPKTDGTPDFGEQHEGVLIGVMKSYLIVALLLGTLVMIAGKKFESLEADLLVATPASAASRICARFNPSASRHLPSRWCLPSSAPG
jgi:hypothetical protein